MLKCKPENGCSIDLFCRILISMINNVSAMANTPSQKASSREVWLVSDMACFH